MASKPPTQAGGMRISDFILPLVGALATAYRPRTLGPAVEAFGGLLGAQRAARERERQNAIEDEDRQRKTAELDALSRAAAQFSETEPVVGAPQPVTVSTFLAGTPGSVPGTTLAGARKISDVLMPTVDEKDTPFASLVHALGHGAPDAVPQLISRHLEQQDADARALATQRAAREREQAAIDAAAERQAANLQASDERQAANLRAAAEREDARQRASAESSIALEKLRGANELAAVNARADGAAPAKEPIEKVSAPVADPDGIRLMLPNGRMRAFKSVDEYNFWLEHTPAGQDYAKAFARSRNAATAASNSPAASVAGAVTGARGITEGAIARDDAGNLLRWDGKGQWVPLPR